MQLASRLAVAVSALLLATVAISAIRHPNIAPGLKPHLALVAFWSVVFAVGMLELAFPHDFLAPWIIPALNAAAAMTVGAVAVFIARIVRQVPK